MHTTGIRWLAALMGAWMALPAGAGELVLVDAGVSRMPIVVFENAPPFTRRAADELADYIEKSSGARPDVIEGRPEPLPERAIWVGFQPVLESLFPDVDFDFAHPEEILIAANERHLVIAGRDRWNPDHLSVSYLNPLGGGNPGGRGTVDVDGVQLEYGTANAVYTFLQDTLGVRWFWPGELGEDVPRRETIAVEPFVHRYHPQIRGRGGLFFFSHLAQRAGHSHEWTRFQRLQLDSLWVQSWHPLSYWWEAFHETNPGYFALQPDGTRSGWPGPRAAKFCQSNPAVWEEWMRYVERELERYPNQTVFSAAANDGGAQGFCVCENCRAWDPPEGERVRYTWHGLSREEVGQADRNIMFANHLGRLLRERYPDRDYYVSVMAYGNSRPAPGYAVPDENVIIDLVFNIHNRAGMGWGVEAGDHRRQLIEWTALGFPHYGWRPNLGAAAGWQLGMPNVAMRRAMADMRFVAERGILSLNFDSIWEHWANQGPHYYILAQMAWNPYADGEAILADYYHRAFGPAAEAMAAYWTLLEDASEEIVHGEASEADVWNADFYRAAYALLDQAATAAAEAPDIFARRIAFVRAGLDYMRLYYENTAFIARLVATSGRDAEADAAARANWEELDRIFTAHPAAFNPSYIGTPRGRAGLGRMRTIHPDFYASGRLAEPVYRRPEGPAIRLVPAEEAGWELVFSDDFNRAELGDDWKVIGGIWSMEDGGVRGAGTLSTTRGFPGDGTPMFQRMEYEVIVDAEPGDDGAPPPISDFSSVLHGRAADAERDFLQSGYFFQFGWRMNLRNRISRSGRPIMADNSPETLIEPGRVHRVAVENDSGALRIFVDGEMVIDAADPEPLVGRGQDRVGLFFYMPAKLLRVNVYVKAALGGPDME